MKDVSTNIGGIGGSLLAYLLSVNLSQVIEVALFAFVGAGVGEGVKMLVSFLKKRYSGK
jgi:hypothetical protein